MSPTLSADSGTAHADRGTHELKGVPGPWRLFAVLEKAEDSRVDPDRRLGLVDRSLTAVSRRAPLLMRGLVSISRLTGR